MGYFCIVDLVGKRRRLRLVGIFSHTLIRFQSSLFTACGIFIACIHRRLHIIRSFHRHRLLLLYLYKYKSLCS